LGDFLPEKSPKKYPKTEQTARHNFEIKLSASVVQTEPFAHNLLNTKKFGFLLMPFIGN